MNKFCKVCGSRIPERRVQMGYNTTCVNHSTAVKYTGVIASSGKTDYEINVIRDPEAAKHVVQLSNIY